METSTENVKNSEIKKKKQKLEPCFPGLTTAHAQPRTQKGPVAEARERMGTPILKGEQNQSKKKLNCFILSPLFH